MSELPTWKLRRDSASDRYATLTASSWFTTEC